LATKNTKYAQSYTVKKQAFFKLFYMFAWEQMVSLYILLYED